MNRRVTAAMGLLLLALFVRPTGADGPKDAEARLLEDLKFLTSDACEGRGIGSKGIDLAAEHIERQFVNAGLKPGGPGGSYFQPFTRSTATKVGAGNRLVLKGPLGQTITLEHGKHFTTAPFGANGKAAGEVVFAGHGITAEDPQFDDYAGLDVAGKVVVVLSGTPRLGHSHADVFAAAKAGTPYTARRKVANALRHKAAAVLIVNPRSTAKLGDFLRPPLGPLAEEPVKLPAAWLPRDLADAMLFSATGRHLADVEQATDADLKPRGTPLRGWTCQLETDLALSQVKARNIIAVAEGSGPLAKETVVIGAHYDHVGMFGALRPFPGKVVGFSPPGGIGGVGFPLARLADSAIHHGADDNASGTVTILELARRFGAMKERKGRRLVFMTFSAEESGLLGSKYYCRNPVFPLEDTITMINLDMVGRLQDDKLLVGGVGSAREFGPLLDRLNAKHRFALTRDPSGFGPSDHASFYAKKVPVLFFFTGFHEQYHCPTDRVETINVPGLRRIVDLIGDIAAEVTTNPARPAYQKTPGFDRSKTLWSAAPSVGVMPDYRAAGPGVVVDDVVKDSVAAKAGLKKGDRILTLAGKQVDNPAAFLAIARALPAGKKVEVAVERDAKRTELALELVHPRANLRDPYFGFERNFGDTKGGILLTDVPGDSPAGKAGLKKGDRLVTIAGQAVRDVKTYLAVLRTLQGGTDVQVTVARDGREQAFQVRIAGKAKAPPPPPKNP